MRTTKTSAVPVASTIPSNEAAVAKARKSNYREAIHSQTRDTFDTTQPSAANSSVASRRGGKADGTPPTHAVAEVTISSSRTPRAKPVDVGGMLRSLENGTGITLKHIEELEGALGDDPTPYQSYQLAYWLHAARPGHIDDAARTALRDLCIRFGSRIEPNYLVDLADRGWDVPGADIGAFFRAVENLGIIDEITLGRVEAMIGGNCTPYQAYNLAYWFNAARPGHITVSAKLGLEALVERWAPSIEQSYLVDLARPAWFVPGFDVDGFLRRAESDAGIDSKCVQDAATLMGGKPSGYQAYLVAFWSFAAREGHIDPVARDALRSLARAQIDRIDPSYLKDLADRGWVLEAP